MSKFLFTACLICLISYSIFYFGFPTRWKPKYILQNLNPHCKKQHKIPQTQKLLNHKTGELLIKGGYTWNPSQIIYNRNAIQHNSLRIKEWDYFLVRNSQYAIALTIANIGFVGTLSIHFVDFSVKHFINHAITIPFPSFQLPYSPVMNNELCIHRSKEGYICFKTFDDKNFTKREISFQFFQFKDLQNDRKNISGTFELMNWKQQKDSISIIIPFDESQDYFYHNYKLNYANQVNGSIHFENGERIEFKYNDSEATFDWGRGVWPYKSTWYWSSATCHSKQGERIGFNLGYGFGNNCKATENVFYYEREAFKLGHVNFIIPKEDSFVTRDKWLLKSEEKISLEDGIEGEIYLEFAPLLNRRDVTNLGIILQNANQVFGYFTGFCKLKDGRIIKIENLIGFAEEVENKW